MRYSRENLLHLIERDKFLKIIESFTNATDITIDINDVDGNPLVEHEFFYGFCSSVRSTPEGLRRCIRSNAEVGFKTAATGEVCYGTCHAGIMLMAVPLVVNEQFWGSITCGQMHLTPPGEQGIGEMLRATADLGLDREHLIKTFQEIQVFTPEKCQAASQLIQYVVNYITELIYRASVQEQKNREKLRSMHEAKTRAELENSLRMAELKNLQAQIKPHFLFNTLNVITSLVTLHENDKALKTLYALSNLLRYNVQHPAELVPLHQELKYVQSYLTIQQTRFGERLKTRIDLDERLLDLPVPFLSLQPLVENACIHGLEPKEGTGGLLITAQAREDRVEIHVVDDGVGIPPAVLETLRLNLKRPQLALPGRTERGIGLRNVDERLKIHFGREFGLLLESRPGETRVRMLLPVNGPVKTGGLNDVQHIAGGR
ncbi:sensor histidine kinase [Desulfotomaculum copahuensis]|uniref:Histidine kinase n=1 Tax=Desulfotomaculum copahuensis TaxID=1838280 RepID=A0A1B7LJN6_9FIRM|nr:PocR ligand-binding domain-containing protein [Desulfotomaculum copahuensis]OAT86778.1 histidine kinase [Desulfotomaculum copahuensis]